MFIFRISENVTNLIDVDFPKTTLIYTEISRFADSQYNIPKHFCISAQ